MALAGAAEGILEGHGVVLFFVGEVVSPGVLLLLVFLIKVVVKVVILQLFLAIEGYHRFAFSGVVVDMKGALIPEVLLVIIILFLVDILGVLRTSPE